MEGIACKPANPAAGGGVNELWIKKRVIVL
jgi:hypothetical protein